MHAAPWVGDKEEKNSYEKSCVHVNRTQAQERTDGRHKLADPWVGEEPAAVEATDDSQGAQNDPFHPGTSRLLQRRADYVER